MLGLRLENCNSYTFLIIRIDTLECAGMNTMVYPAIKTDIGTGKMKEPHHSSRTARFFLQDIHITDETAAHGFAVPHALASAYPVS